MDFKDQIKQLGERVSKMKDSIFTEEATKNALVMPFLQCLGYDVFDPTEIVPEFVCDIPTKKGEKIDYAIFKDGEPIILIECKHWSENLDIHQGQLIRYFAVSKTRFGILTNGIVYRFYTDLENENIMDETPFFEIKIDDLRDQQIEKLKEFHKSYFDIDNIINTASELKYTNALRSIFQKEMQDPSDELTKYFAKNVYQSNITAKVLDYFKDLFKQTFVQFINDSVNERLKSALNKQEEQEKQRIIEQKQEADAETQELIASEEEMEGFRIVRAICRPKIAADRISFRKGNSYFSIIVDNTNRKPICHLMLNGKRKYIGTFDAQKNETKAEIGSLDDIYNFIPALTEAVGSYIQKTMTVTIEEEVNS